MTDTQKVEVPFGLMSLLATMKAAQEQRVSMAVWDRDIKTVEEAIATINTIRARKA
jgi:hypothetical protein